MKQTLKEANYKHLKTLKGGEHLLLNLETKGKEIWFTNKNHSSYGLIYKNTHLEFARSFNN